MKCEYCNNDIPIGSSNCPACGAPAPQAPTPQQSVQGQTTTSRLMGPTSPVPAESRERMIYILLAVFLGCLGIHNFYIGRTYLATLQLLLSVLTVGTLAIPVGIWAIVEACMNTNDAWGRPLV